MNIKYFWDNNEKVMLICNIGCIIIREKCEYEILVG